MRFILIEIVNIRTYRRVDENFLLLIQRNLINIHAFAGLHDDIALRINLLHLRLDTDRIEAVLIHLGARLLLL